MVLNDTALQVQDQAKKNKALSPSNSDDPTSSPASPSASDSCSPNSYSWDVSSSSSSILTRKDSSSSASSLRLLDIHNLRKLDAELEAVNNSLHSLTSTTNHGNYDHTQLSSSTTSSNGDAKKSSKSSTSQFNTPQVFTSIHSHRSKIWTIVFALVALADILATLSVTVLLPTLILNKNTCSFTDVNVLPSPSPIKGGIVDGMDLMHGQHYQSTTASSVRATQKLGDRMSPKKRKEQLLALFEEQKRGAKPKQKSGNFRTFFTGLFKVRGSSTKNNVASSSNYADGTTTTKIEGAGIDCKVGEKENEATELHSYYESVLYFFSHHQMFIGWIFCIFWLCESFRKAKLARDDALKRQQDELIDNNHVDDKHFKSKEEEKYLPIWSPHSLFWKRPEVIFTQHLLIHLALLPVGFYTQSMFYANLNYYNGTKKSIAYMNASNNTPSVFDESIIESAVLQYVNWSKSQKHSPIGVLSRMIRRETANFITVQYDNISTQIRNVFMKRIKSRRTVSYVIKNPRPAKRRVMSFLSLIRLQKYTFQYLLPLQRKIRRFRKYTTRLRKVHEQRMQRKNAKRIKKQMWNKILAQNNNEETRIQAAIRIQKMIRGYRSRKWVKTLNLIEKKYKDKVALRIQRLLRARALRAREEVKQKHMLLLEMMKQESFGEGEYEYNSKQWRGIKHELEVLCNKKKAEMMLLRPNARFTVVWNLVFVGIVVIEVMKAILKPWTVNEGKRVKFRLFLRKALVPTRIEDWESCSSVATGRFGRTFEYFGYFVNTTSIASRAKIITPTYVVNAGSTIASSIASLLPSFLSKESNSDQQFWYCSAPYTTIQSGYIHIMESLINGGAVFISTAYFLNVFVDFFTGEYDADGVLISKPFFKRWIYPGLAMQLFINPAMADIFLFIKNVVDTVGSARLIRWAIALFIPVIKYASKLFKWNVWMKFVYFKNNKLSRWARHK